ncbi:MAG: M48 family metalloprotease [Candidatus Sumerlaeia bacterium]
MIAHELGHVTRRHGASQVSRQQGMDIVGQILLGTDAAAAAQLLSGIVSSGVMFNYSREDEREADAIAVGTLTRIGYDPLAMRDFFVKIKTKYGDASGPVTTLFASHPPTAERIANVENLAAQLSTGAKNRPTQELNRIKAALK